MWEGDIRPLAEDRPIAFDGGEFRTLEALFLRVAGERYAPVPALDWL